MLPNIQSNVADITATYTRRQQFQPKFSFSCEKNTTAMTGTGTRKTKTAITVEFLLYKST